MSCVKTGDLEQEKVTAAPLPLLRRYSLDGIERELMMKQESAD